MKTTRETCVFLYLGLVAGSLATSALCQPANTRNSGETLFVGGAPGSARGRQTVASEPGQAAKGHSIAGEWQGRVANQHLILEFEQTADASFTGKLVAVDQGNVTLAIDEISLTPGGALRLEVKSADAVYEAKLSDDGSELVGTWHQGSNSFPLTFRRPGASAAKSTLKPRTLGSIALEPCRTTDGNTEALCGKYEVYENRESRTGRRIALNIMMLAANTPKPEADPFFALAGGPGQSATEFLPLAGYIAKVRGLRDVLLVDQRGTGKSNQLACKLQETDDAQAILGEPYPLEKIRECRAESERKADLKQYTTSIAAEDLDEVRQAMGYEKINVFGGSYGSKAALVYLRLHGDHVRTITLEAVASPQFLNPLPFAKALQSSVDGVMALCEAEDACRKDYPNLRKEFNTVVERLEKSPAKFEVKNQSVTMSREMFFSALRRLLYVPAVVSAFPLMVHSTYENDWNQYAEQTLALAGVLEGAVARGTFFAAVCAEDVPRLTEAAIRRETEGTYLGDTMVRRFQKYCGAWGPSGSIPKDFYSPVRSRVPALLISGALDPATPPESAYQVAHDLVNSRVIVVKQGTHGTGSPCIDGLIGEFVKQGSAAGLDASCAEQVYLPPFVTPTQAINPHLARHGAAANSP